MSLGRLYGLDRTCQKCGHKLGDHTLDGCPKAKEQPPAVVAGPSPLDVAGDIARMARVVKKDWRQIGVLSTGEQIAVALVLNRVDLLPNGYENILDAVERLGDDWLRAARIAQKVIA